jgi:hypothetical protein
MHHLIGAMVIGAVAGVASRDGVRQGLRRIVKTGIVAKRKAQALGAAVVEQAHGIVDEARADMDQPGTKRPRKRPT